MRHPRPKGRLAVNRAVPIRTPAELYAHAIAIEREAAEEQGHIAMVEQAMVHTRDVRVDWSPVFGD